MRIAPVKWGRRWSSDLILWPLNQSMQNNNTAGLQNTGTDTHQQVLDHLHRLSLGDSICQVCEASLTAGDQLTVYLYKLDGSSRYTVGQYRCRSHNDDLTSLFSLGVRELIVTGRVGHRQDHTTDQTCAVLVSPTVRVISASDTTTGRVPPGPQTDTVTWNYGVGSQEIVGPNQPPNSHLPRTAHRDTESRSDD